MLNDGAPVPKDNGTIPDDKGAAAMVAATDIVAAAENNIDALETLIVFSEIASKMHYILLHRNLFIMYLRNRWHVWYVLYECSLCTAWALSIYWADVSCETITCLVCWVLDIAEWSVNLTVKAI